MSWSKLTLILEKDKSFAWKYFPFQRIPKEPWIRSNSIWNHWSSSARIPLGWSRGKALTVREIFNVPPILWYWILGFTIESLRCTKPDRKEFSKIAIATAIGFGIMVIIADWETIVWIFILSPRASSVSSSSSSTSQSITSLWAHRRRLMLKKTWNVWKRSNSGGGDDFPCLWSELEIFCSCLVLHLFYMQSNINYPWYMMHIYWTTVYRS